MILLKSKTISTDKSVYYMFDYLSDLSNFERLMPDNVRSFQIENDCAILDIQGIGKLELAVTEAISPKKIVMLPLNKVPFKFDIQWHIDSTDDGSKIHAIINADLNLMMKMMAKKPLNDFINVQIQKLSNELS